LLDLLSRFWPLLLLVQVPWLVRLVVVLLHRILRSRLDHAIADDLPRTAGEWLEERLAASRLAGHVSAFVSEHRLLSDSYLPRRRLIHLEPDTHFKADPVYWAIAAHELGHALFHHTHPAISALMEAARSLKAIVLGFGLAAIVANLLYALPGVTEVGFVCVAVALVLELPVLVDEANASVTAGRLLRGELRPAHFRAVRLTLFSAFCTYLAAFATTAILVTQLDRVIDAGGAAPVTGAPPAGWHASLVAVLSIVGVAYALARLRAWLTPDRPHHLVILASIPWTFALLALVVELWDARASAAWVWAVILASIPAWRAVAYLAALSGALIYAPLKKLHDLLVGRWGGVETSPAFLQARSRGMVAVAAGSSAAEELLRRPEPPRRLDRLLQLSELLYLPLLALHWLG
jgi:Zn-dependent membrane protease YugP